MCRSAEYDSSQLVCRLSRSDRRTDPASYVEAASPTTEYLENQCAPGECRGILSDMIDLMHSRKHYDPLMIKK